MLPEDSLHAARCTTCGTLAFPARCVCPDCGEADFVPVSLVGLEGEVISWTTVRSLPPGIAAPQIHLAIVRLENGLQALGRLDVQEPRIGARVRSTSGPVRHLDGEDVEGLIFVELEQ